MKYGETLRQRSIPAWSHHNIDYDDVKNFIKENTTPGHGKTISVPGRTDDKLLAFEKELFHILAEQHSRIGLFVKSKVSEIQHRLDDSNRRLRQLAARRTDAADGRIPVRRLERYGLLETGVVKVGDEIKSLARFIATQRTAFRKLLKKYQKWTKSGTLEARFRDEVLEDPKSFTRLDLGFMLDDYSATRQSIRTLYEDYVRQSTEAQRTPASLAPKSGSSTIRQLQDAVDTASKVSFDTSIATVPLGPNGTLASYFVHKENVVELQVLLLQYTRYHSSRSRSNSIATPVSSEPHTRPFSSKGTDFADFHLLAADTLSRFAQEQSALTVNEREHLPGSCPQRAKASVRWNNDEDALACLRSRSSDTKTAFLKRKYVNDFFDTCVEFTPKQEVSFSDSVERVDDLRRELLRDEVKPLFHYSSCRSRLIGLDDGAEGMVLATLDTGVTIGKADKASEPKSKVEFPFALLSVRQEGSPKSDLVSVLDDSYLVERVRGFSIEYHSVWQNHRPENIPPPYWLPILDRDIRKLPPPAMKRKSTAEGSGSGTLSTVSPASVGDSTTAAENYNDPPMDLQQPPLRSFRKKKRRHYPEAQSKSAPQQRYWSEYDHPEDDEGEAFYILMDPNDKNAVDRLFDRVGALFRRKNAEEEALLPSPDSPHDDESSSDEEAGTHRIKHSRGFGTFPRPSNATGAQKRSLDHRSSLTPFAGTCFVASLAILLLAFILHTTARHKYIRQVHWGILFAIICSLAFVLVGFLSVLRGGKHRDRHPTLPGWAISVTVLLLDAVGAGGLLASMFG
ncbi:SPX domain-containing [Lecanosticta acicola]|uniref:SPX domain-containing n=1 Tax=Lecanosticta acicola TaxID=111012 RepID=A0AAI8YTX2_9PEZI|nr:SPX domain-containing [Lecanosticta acicola]